MDLGILDKASSLLNGDRADSYGDVVENFTAIKNVANVLLRHKNLVLDEIDICDVLIALKVAREGHKNKIDNKIDLAAYANIKQVLIERLVKSKSDEKGIGLSDKEQKDKCINYDNEIDTTDFTRDIVKQKLNK
jgi:hypothetical protein